jgi:hypothetical protein
MSLVSQVGSSCMDVALRVRVLSVVISSFHSFILLQRGKTNGQNKVRTRLQLHSEPAIQGIQYGVNLVEDTVGSQYIGH